MKERAKLPTACIYSTRRLGHMQHRLCSAYYAERRGLSHRVLRLLMQVRQPPGRPVRDPQPLMPRQRLLVRLEVEELELEAAVGGELVDQVAVLPLGAVPHEAHQVGVGEEAQEADLSEPLLLTLQWEGPGELRAAEEGGGKGSG